MSRASDDLRAWLDRAELGLPQFARELGVAHVTLWRWLDGQRTPSLRQAAEIERRTGIPASRWVAESGPEKST